MRRRAFASTQLGSGAVGLAVLLAACSGGDPFAPLPKPDPIEIEQTTTTVEPDLTGVPLAPALGATSTTVALGPGPMTLVGVVQGPEGPVGGAIVELERVVGDGSASARVPTAADGTWNLPNVLGGRYRIRAWRSPDLATAASTIVFLETQTTRAVDLTLAEVGGVRVDAAIAPDPPIVDEDANLKVRVAERSVDAEGVVRDTPAAGVSVMLTGNGAWSVSSSNPATTGSDGSVVYRLRCRSDGTQTLSATLEGTETYALAIAACVEREETTTTTADDGDDEDDDEATTTSTSTSTTEP